MNSNWYYFNKTINKNTVRFYAIDTNLENLSEKMKLEQREGLIKSIKNSGSAKWNILYGHHPIEALVITATALRNYEFLQRIN